ncbi:hypothetical protein DI458_17405 [Burkholderia contaminans]|nr:hypothetical protein [Burkholderia contaminans]MBA9839349.1 hypothetical protein [Burkholderia contaminans]MBA9864822.1 hypothetical protein [Burkholderia contaminans]MBA9906852.1 hypothetical protein [Burkholderia contaminans]MBA9930737.1 hypothetical protein [Burkholderia contaminans]
MITGCVDELRKPIESLVDIEIVKIFGCAQLLERELFLGRGFSIVHCLVSMSEYMSIIKIG